MFQMTSCIETFLKGLNLMDIQTLWYGVIGLSVLLYAILDGFDLGVGAIHLFAKNDTERRIFLNAIGPVWDGNEVWIVIVMGGLFAGFPDVYASLFSGFYTLLMFLIAGLMFRAAAIEFRSKGESKVWRSFWDVIFSVSSVLVAFVLGVIMGNLIAGIPLDSSQNYVGTFSDFFRPYCVLVGIMAAALFTMHGTIYLAMKTENEAHETVSRWINKTIAVFLFWYLVVTVATFIYMPHMMQRFIDHKGFAIIPLLSLIAIFFIPYFVKKGWHGWAFIFSSLSIAFLLSLYCLGTYPILVDSLISPETNSLTIYNSASTPKTLRILMTVVMIGVPLVLAYGYWVYRIFRGKVKLDASSY